MGYSYPIYPDRWFDYDLDRAIVFMARAIDACGHNPKPLVTHRVWQDLHRQWTHLTADHDSAAAWARLSARSFARDWASDEDAVYDALS